VSGPSDIAVLRTARGSAALPVLRILISGFASRHDLPVDRLDDLGLALETLLADESEGEGELVLEVTAVSGGLRLRLGGLLNQNLKDALLTTDLFQPRPGCLLDVRLLLDSLLDGYRVLDADAHPFVVEMEKRAF
jgi:hypothetical protein